jgi:hypothetical protein
MTCAVVINKSFFSVAEEAVGKAQFQIYLRFSFSWLTGLLRHLSGWHLFIVS